MSYEITVKLDINNTELDIAIEKANWLELELPLEVLSIDSLGVADKISREELVSTLCKSISKPPTTPFG